MKSAFVSYAALASLSTAALFGAAPLRAQEARTFPVAATTFNGQWPDQINSLRGPVIYCGIVNALGSTAARFQNAQGQGLLITSVDGIGSSLHPTGARAHEAIKAAKAAFSEAASCVLPSALPERGFCAALAQQNRNLAAAKKLGD